MRVSTCGRFGKTEVTDSQKRKNPPSQKREEKAACLRLFTCVFYFERDPGFQEVFTIAMEGEG